MTTRLGTYDPDWQKKYGTLSEKFAGLSNTEPMPAAQYAAKFQELNTALETTFLSQFQTLEDVIHYYEHKLIDDLALRCAQYNSGEFITAGDLMDCEPDGRTRAKEDIVKEKARKPIIKITLDHEGIRPLATLSNKEGLETAQDVHNQYQAQYIGLDERFLESIANIDPPDNVTKGPWVIPNNE